MMKIDLTKDELITIENALDEYIKLHNVNEPSKYDKQEKEFATALLAKLEILR